MINRLVLLKIIICLLVGTYELPVNASENPVLAIVLPAGQALKSPTASEISLIFMRKKLFWPNGKRIRPANMPVNHPWRIMFSNQLLGSLPVSQNDYWNELYFHGVTPPHVVNSAEGMLRYVAETVGSIGYVDACLVDARVKAIGWLSQTGGYHETPPDFACP